MCQRGGVARDHPFLIGIDHQRHRLVAGADDAGRAADGAEVGAGVDFETERAKALQRHSANAGRVLADTAGENHGIETPQRHGQGANVAGEAMNEHVQRQDRPRMSRGSRVAQLAAIVRQLGKAEKAALIVEHRVHFVEGPAGAPHEVDERAGVHVAGPGAHDQAFQRRHAHGGIDAMPVLYRGGRGSVTEMRGDQAVIGRVEAEHAHRFLRHVAVAGAVETVAANGVIAVDPHRQGIEIGCWLHGLVERGVHHGDVRNCRHSLDRMPNDEQRRGVMQRRQMTAGLDVDNNSRRYDDRGAYEFAAMHDTVTDRGQVSHPLAPIKLRQNRVKGGRVGGGWKRNCRFPLLVCEGDRRPHGAKTLGEARQLRCPYAGLVDSKFQRRRPAVQYEYQGGVSGYGTLLFADFVGAAILGRPKKRSGSRLGRNDWSYFRATPTQSLG